MKWIAKKASFLKRFVKNHKIASAITLVVVIALVLILKPKAPIPLETQQADIGNITQVISVTGNITSQNIANLSFQSGGKLSYLYGKIGDRVYQWQIIASLDKTKLAASLRQGEQDFNAAKAVVEQVYDQTKRVPDLTFEQKVSQTSAEATQNKAYDNIKIVQQQLADANLVTPIAGTIIRQDVTIAGVNVTGANVFTVADDINLIFQMDIDQADVSKIHIGQAVKVVLDSYPNTTINSVVSSINFSSHTTSTGGNAYTVKTQILDNKNGPYRIGMNGDVDIIISKKSNVLIIPISAIFDEDKVYIKTSSGIVKKSVKIGLQNYTDSEITSGLSRGDLVILQPSSVPDNK